MYGVTRHGNTAGDARAYLCYSTHSQVLAGNDVHAAPSSFTQSPARECHQTTYSTSTLLCPLVRSISRQDTFSLTRVHGRIQLGRWCLSPPPSSRDGGFPAATTPYMLRTFTGLAEDYSSFHVHAATLQRRAPRQAAYCHPVSRALVPPLLSSSALPQ